MGRLRTNSNAPELIKQYSNCCNLDNFKFPKKDAYLEIGCGKGDFLIQQAINNPNIFFLGIEKYSTVILKALKKIKKDNLKLNNLTFCCADAKNININIFQNKISKLFLNFSDPWPKKRHEKRRLTSPVFLEIYKQILTKDALVEFKTDNDNLYRYTLNVLKNRQDVNLIHYTNNLYLDLKSKLFKNNIQTEYEKKFVLLGKNINKIVWSFTK